MNEFKAGDRVHEDGLTGVVIKQNPTTGNVLWQDDEVPGPVGQYISNPGSLVKE